MRNCSFTNWSFANLLPSSLKISNASFDDLQHHRESYFCHRYEFAITCDISPSNFLSLLPFSSQNATHIAFEVTHGIVGVTLVHSFYLSPPKSLAIPMVAHEIIQRTSHRVPYFSVPLHIDPDHVQSHYYIMSGQFQMPCP